MFILEFFRNIGIAALDVFSGSGMSFNGFGEFVKNMYYMGVGMLTILIVIGVIILITMALNKIFSGKGNE